MTREERAKQYANRYLGAEALWKLAYNRYLEIATEQQNIDIEKAVEVFTKFVRYYLSMISPEKRRGRYIKHEIEMFKQAMKGEEK